MNYQAIGRAVTDAVLTAIACVLLYVAGRLWLTPGDLIGDSSSLLTLIVLLLPALVMGWVLGARVTAQILPHAALAVLALNAVEWALGSLLPDLPPSVPSDAFSWANLLRTTGLTLLAFLGEMVCCLVALKLRHKLLARAVATSANRKP